MDDEQKDWRGLTAKDREATRKRNDPKVREAEARKIALHLIARLRASGEDLEQGVEDANDIGDEGLEEKLAAASASLLVAVNELQARVDAGNYRGLGLL
ncbi:hypothetical protein LTR56_021009 [Elasticomyces elasticus]|nr:hypothetical protein LTR56_021009 [Elasticomyces elasticus]KAK3628853.1 hypothetical protein LTR22_022182 [Elasticomyces elasticus]KAK4909749.1 hypothetical protein LTR49_021482 [Elasticomyces elasticus]KAK5738641.1 hypothetical protein LTS12_025503 [Elasticomyces elasticus]